MQDKSTTKFLASHKLGKAIPLKLMRCCFRDSASVTYEGMLPSDLTLSALRFILSAKSIQSCLQDCETVDFYNSLIKSEHNLLSRERGVCIHQCTHSLTITQTSMT